MTFSAVCLWAQTRLDNSVMLQHGAVVYETPKVYELMNIALALLDKDITVGQTNLYYNNIDTSTAYYRSVMAYFEPYKQHPFIQAMNQDLRRSPDFYMGNLRLAYDLAYHSGKLLDDVQLNLPKRIKYFRHVQQKSLIADFIADSNFEAFYAQHQSTYRQTLARAHDFLQADSIKSWLEGEFPSRYDSYKIVISPLMNAWHFTHRFTKDKRQTTVMWVSSADDYLPGKYTLNQLKGIYTGVVFTEIDHNYVNPVSDQYKKQLKTIMGGDYRVNWIKADGDARLYTDGYKVFNEYMTHAVYLLYTNLKFPAADQAKIADNRVQMMAQRRKYYRFDAFYQQLQSLYLAKSPGQTIPDLYPAMIAWVQAVNAKP